MPDYPRIPYGWADFRAIRLDGRLYVDKTRFLRRLEEERYVVLTRPRRFGKSCWVSVLENYYDRNRAGEFEALFGGTDVGRRPTDDRHDVTSGFNIGRNLSLHPDFNELLGFTEPEVLGLLQTYRDRGAFSQDVDAALGLMRAWYDGYRFAPSAATDVYNTDMVLYYLNESLPNRPVPDDLIDLNVRIDYGKLRHLLVAGRQLNGNFDVLRQVVGEGAVETPIQPGFPLERLDQPENCCTTSAC